MIYKICKDWEISKDNFYTWDGEITFSLHGFKVTATYSPGVQVWRVFLTETVDFQRHVGHFHLNTYNLPRKELSDEIDKILLYKWRP